MKVEFRRKDAPALVLDVERVPVAGDYVDVGDLARVLAVILTPGGPAAAVAFLVRDIDGWPDEVKHAG